MTTPVIPRYGAFAISFMGVFIGTTNNTPIAKVIAAYNAHAYGLNISTVMMVAALGTLVIGAMGLATLAIGVGGFFLRREVLLSYPYFEDQRFQLPGAMIDNALGTGVLLRLRRAASRLLHQHPGSPQRVELPAPISFGEQIVWMPIARSPLTNNGS